uniref:HAT C-terminal dimerisation domain-containing protein n=1 Tax=Chelydra serpentina TaxID=8475 RepID=A0A8C3T3A4_CHESE
ELHQIIGSEHQLQGKGANRFSHQSIIKAFLDKLALWIIRVEGNNLVEFPYVDSMLGKKEAIRMQILDHLRKLRDEFQRYFPELDRPKDGLSFIRDPFTTDVNSVPEDLQEEFLDLKNDFATQDVYQQSTIEKFWASMTGSCPTLSAHAVRFLLPFASSYMCEMGFLCLLHIKSKQRNQLAVERDIRCALSSTTPNIEKLVSEKRIQTSSKK